MNELIIYTALAVLVTVIIGILTFLRSKTPQTAEDQTQNVPEPEERPAPAQRVEAGGARARMVANRNARARMRVAQAQRELEHSDSEDEVQELGDEIALPDGKIGKKKLAKLQMKAEKRAMREAEEREREEKKEREELKEEKRKQLEKEREEEEAKKEEEERLKREEEERKEQEEYERLKAQFLVEEEGFDENDDEGKMNDIFKEFLNYIKRNKVVVLEDLAALFKLKTQAVIDRIVQLQKDENLTGVIDDRGKFIYISQEELESVAKFIRQRGRVSISDLAEASNSLINLTPDTSVEA